MDNRTLRPAAYKRLKDTYKDNGVVLPHIERHVMKHPQLHIRPDDHSLKHLHPSDMSKQDWCGRHDFYRIIGTPVEKVTQRNPSFTMENALAEGHTIHDKYQQWLRELEVLWGMWKCRECSHIFGALSPKTCQFCGSDRLSYREVPLRRQTMHVEGHADGAVHNLHGFTGLVEIKSIGIATLRFEAPRLHQRYLNGEPAEDIWDSISRPFGSHLRQGQLYLWMAWPTYEQIVFIYESKFTSRVKEFVVDYNKSYIEPVLETAFEITQALKSGTPPSRPLWAEDPEGKVCVSCEYRGTCWSIGGNSDAAQADDPAPVLVRRANSAVRRRALRKTPLRPA